VKTRKRDAVEATTITNRRSALDKHIYPFMGDRLPSDVNNRAARELVEHLDPKLSAASIRNYLCIVKAVVASAINDDGEEVFPRKWNEEYIDAPVVENQRQPTTDGKGMDAVLNAASGQYRMLYALLAGCGPMRRRGSRPRNWQTHQ